jgi:dTDP-4-dehydrorhamnose 3,5-epimerase
MGWKIYRSNTGSQSLLMNLTETSLAGAFIIEPIKISDERGFFARTWCQRELDDIGLNTRISQCSLSHNINRGTTRGMHFQAAPYSETKIITCIRGSIHDVIIDLRPDSPTYMDHYCILLTAASLKMLYVPRGFAHGFQTMEDDSLVYYQISDFHHSGAARGYRWDDPAFAIEWPHTDVRILSEQDRKWPAFVNTQSS